MACKKDDVDLNLHFDRRPVSNHPTTSSILYTTFFTTLFFTRPLKKMTSNPAWISALEGQLKENPKSVSEYLGFGALPV
jgi:hypothetical protein